eukprot:SAG11_NODE_329_length_10681_cov_7.861274_9_plen_348_part_00
MLGLRCSASAPSLTAPELSGALKLIAAQGQQLDSLQAQLQQVLASDRTAGDRRAGGAAHTPAPAGSNVGGAPAVDDTALLDGLAHAGSAIMLEPRAYHRRGTWRLTKNGTYVRGWAGLTRLVVQQASPGAPFSGISISACPLNDTNARCAYGNQYSRDKPLSHVYVEGISIELVQNQSLDTNGHCCGAGPAGNAAGGTNGAYGLVVTNVAHGHATDISVSGAHFQGIGIVNSASFHLIRPVSTFCFSTDIAINDFSFDCSITDATVTTDGWPTATNWTGQFKDDALAVQGYTKGNRIQGGTVRLGKVQIANGAACVKLSGTSDVIVSDVFCGALFTTLGDCIRPHSR